MSNANQPHSAVIAILEKYLRDAGLFDIIAEHRRPQVLRWHPTFTNDAFWILVWLVIFWLPETGVVLASNGRPAMMFAFFAPPVTLAGYGVLLTVIFTVLTLTNRIPSLALPQPGANQSTVANEQKQNETVGLIGFLVIVVGTPLLLAATVWLYIHAVSLAALYLAIYITLTALTLVLIGASDAVLFRLYVLKGFFSMTWRIVREILRHLPFIASVLLVIVLFSIFSTEFWQALGNLKTSNLFISMSLLIALPLVFTVSSINREAKETLNLSDHKNFLQKIIIEPAERNQLIKAALDDDRLRTEDWVKAKEELEWRETAKLCENIHPSLRKHATWWLIVLLAATVLFLFVAFFIYFLALFYFLIDRDMLATWLAGKPATADMIPVTVPFIKWQHQWPSTIRPMAKVSLLLSAFIAMMSTVHVLTEESVKKRFTEQLSEQACSWIALSCLYRNLISPGYQIWSDPIRHRGLASVSIVTRNPADLASVKSACLDIRSHLQKQRKLVLVTAFEQSKDETAYSYGMHANCWQMVFAPEPNGEHPVQVFALPPPPPAPANNGQAGNTPLAEELSEALHQRLPPGQQITVFDGANFFNVVIRRENLASRRDYLNLMQTSLGAFNRLGLDPAAISVYVYKGDTQEELAFLLYSQQVEFVAYRDSLNDKIRFLKSRKLFRALA